MGKLPLRMHPWHVQKPGESVCPSSGGAATAFDFGFGVFGVGVGFGFGFGFDFGLAWLTLGRFARFVAVPVPLLLVVESLAALFCVVVAACDADVLGAAMPSCFAAANATTTFGQLARL